MEGGPVASGQGGAPASPDDQARWAEAEARLVRGPTPVDLHRTRRYRRRVWLLAAVLLVLALATGLLIGSDRGDSAEPDADVAAWREVAGIALSGLGLLVTVVGAVRGWRAGVWRALRTSPLRALTRAQQRAVLREVEGREPADPAHLPLARHLAGQLHRQRRLLPFWLGLCLSQSGRLVAATGAVEAFLAGTSLLAFLVLTAVLWQQSGRAARFLDRHPAPDPARPPD